MYDVGLEVMFLEFVGLLSQPSKCACLYAEVGGKGQLYRRIFNSDPQVIFQV